MMSLPSNFSNDDSGNVFPSGSLYLDRALGKGGFPRGAIVEIFSSEESGKTTLCLHTVAESLKRRQRCLWVDCDGSLTPQFALSRGVDNQELFFTRSDHPLYVMQILHTVTRESFFDLVVVDSFSALFPILTKQETYLSAEEEELRRQLPHWLRQLSLDLEKGGGTTIFTRTLALPPSPVYHGLADDLERLALSLYASVRLKMETVGTIWSNRKPCGWRSRVVVLKNKNLPCSDEAIIDIIYKDGIDKPNEMLALSIEYGLVEQKANGYYYHQRLLGTTLHQAKIRLKDDRSLQRELEADIRRKLF